MAKKDQTVMVRQAPDAYLALKTAQGMVAAGADVFSITVNGPHFIWAYAEPTDFDKIDEAIAKSVNAIPKG